MALLRSPPRTPQYNGAAEAGMGSIKRAAERLAEREGRPAAWTADDVEGARLLLAETARPRRARARESPSTAWRARRSITNAEGAAFQEVVERRRAEIDQDLPPGSAIRAIVERAAIRRALQDLEYLTIRRTGDSTEE